ncbi:MAG: hypothetical protein N2691_05555 [Patescibacteria group bacterium]|nr:hypothetical protein [Patescibacteria group bacterium]
MNTPKPYTEDFWNYLSIPQQDLIIEGNYLKDQIINDAEYSFKDYSFLVFPFSKAYEGYLKQIFLDVGFISHLDYVSDHFRVGKMLSPNLREKNGERSIYTQIERSISAEFADEVWSTWKLHRNEILHYYPHNLKAITFQTADYVAKKILQTMQNAYKRLLLPLRPNPPFRGLKTKSVPGEGNDQWKYE